MIPSVRSAAYLAIAIHFLRKTVSRISQVRPRTNTREPDIPGDGPVDIVLHVREQSCYFASCDSRKTAYDFLARLRPHLPPDSFTTIGPDETRDEKFSRNGINWFPFNPCDFNYILPDDAVDRLNDAIADAASPD